METDYYIEISGEGLSDGMEVKTSANDTATAAAGADDAQQLSLIHISVGKGNDLPYADQPKLCRRHGTGKTQKGEL